LTLPLDGPCEQLSDANCLNRHEDRQQSAATSELASEGEGKYTIQKRSGYHSKRDTKYILVGGGIGAEVEELWGVYKQYISSKYLDDHPENYILLKNNDQNSIGACGFAQQSGEYSYGPANIVNRV